jgi:hypothetical protein
MDTTSRAAAARLHPSHRCRAAIARRWLVLATGLLSGAGAAAHPYGPFGLPIFLPSPPPPSFLRPTPSLMPPQAPARQPPAPRAAPPRQPLPAARPSPQPARMAAGAPEQCRGYGAAWYNCPGQDAAPVAREFPEAGRRP